MKRCLVADEGAIPSFSFAEELTSVKEVMMKKPDKSKKKFQVRKSILGNRRGKQIIGPRGRIRYRKGRSGDGTGTSHLRQLEIELPTMPWKTPAEEVPSLEDLTEANEGGRGPTSMTHRPASDENDA